MQEKTGIELALEKYDNSPTKLANAINATKLANASNGTVLRQHVEHWSKAKRVPAEQAPDVECTTGIPCELLCPGVSWDVLRCPSPEVPPTPTDIARPATETVAGGV